MRPQLDNGHMLHVNMQHANSEFQQTDFEEKSLFFVHRKMETFTQHLDSGFKDPYTICVVKSRVACYVGYVKKAGVYNKIKFGIRVKTRITNKYIMDKKVVYR